MTGFIDEIYFKELSDQDPKDVCQRAGCTYDAANGFYSLTVWDEDYRIFPNGPRIECLGRKNQSLDDYFHLIGVHYLLNSQKIKVHNEWISEKDIPGGSTFFRGPHEIPTRLISDLFGNDIDGFKNRCEALNGVPLALGDTAYVFEITTKIPVAVLYWKGDDEFPAEAKLLYDKSITAHLATDIIYALGVGICEKLAGTGDILEEHRGQRT